MRFLKNTLLLSFFFFSLQATSAHAQDGMIVERSSPLSFDATVEKLIANAKNEGWKVPKKWKKNFQKNLLHVTKQDIGRNLVIEMCEPNEAVKLLKHDEYKFFLSMMPCSIAVYEKSDGTVHLSMMNIQMMASIYREHQPVVDMAERLGPQMERMLDMTN